MEADRGPGIKQLIVNADDFGLTVAVNRAVERAYRQGMVRSATLLANQPGFADAVARARDMPDLAVGVHLNLTWGEPLATPHARGLTDGNGLFPGGPGAVMGRWLSGRISRQAVHQEWMAQVARVVNQGIVPSHLDGHHHVHALPGLWPVTLAVAQQWGIRRVRLCREGGWVGSRWWKRRLVGWGSGAMGRQMMRQGLRAPDWFLGVGLGGGAGKWRHCAESWGGCDRV
ncbi:MAG: ChbG/HpnK family deacetylase [Magnetococcus sp. WYHC-3]